MFVCARVAQLLERRAAGLTESERLRTESHLSECAGCRELSRVLEGARLASAASSAGSLSPQTRELALKRAFDGASASADPITGRAPRLRLALASAAVLLVAALAALLLRPAPATRQADTLVAGKLSSSQGLLQAGATIPVNVALSTEDHARIHVGNASVALDARSRVTWRGEQKTLALDKGAVEVAVEHEPGKKFLVTTPSFIVEVVGTQFRVDQQSVHVTHGTVRVLSHDGRDVLAVLPAGGAWSAPPAQNTPTEPAPAAKAPPELDTEEAEKGHPAALEPVAQRLASARRALAEGRIAEAEKLVEGALASRATSREVAEGRTLLAECAVARGQTERAAQLYLAVARAFPGLPAGENALFAGARLSERALSPQRARALFEDYLRRYPKGRFRLEAERHLQRAATPR